MASNNNNVQLKSGHQVENVAGTAHNTPNNSSTWKEHFQKHAYNGWPSACARLGCNRRATDGAHVRVQGKGYEVFILPLCHPCNQDKKGAFPVDNTEVVKVIVGK